MEVLNLTEYNSLDYVNYLPQDVADNLGRQSVM